MAETAKQYDKTDRQMVLRRLWWLWSRDPQNLDPPIHDESKVLFRGKPVSSYTTEELQSFVDGGAKSHE
jgi:hypothetical protein